MIWKTRLAVKIAADENGVRDEIQQGGYAGQQVKIRQRRRCGKAIKYIWDDGDGEMGWKNGNGLGKYRQRTTTNLRAYRCYDKLGMGATTNLHRYLGCTWRLYVSYCNLNKSTR